MNLKNIIFTLLKLYNPKQLVFIINLFIKNNTIILISVVFLSCNSEKSYTVRGVIVEILEQKQQLMINHNEIPGFMMAMTMPFDIIQSEDLSKFSIGDSVHFKLVIFDNTTIAQDFVIVGHQNIKPIDDFGDWEQDPYDMLEIGDLIDDGTFLDMDSAAISLSDLGEGYLFISYLFTRCPMPNMCPALLVKNQYLANELKDENIYFIVISFDYLYDTPSIMKKKYGYLDEQNPNILFLSSVGCLDDLNLITQQSGISFWGIEENNIGHSLRSVLVSPEGRLLAGYDGTDWLVGVVEKEIRNILLETIE